MLELAESAPVNQLREQAQRVRAKADPNPDTTYQRIHAKRSLRNWTDAEGAGNLHARGPVDQIAKILSALEPDIDQQFTTARRDAKHEPREAYAFDALINRFTRDPAVPDTNTDAKTERKRTRTNPRFLTLLHLDVEALHRGEVEGEERCEIPGVGPIPIRVARGLLGESILKLVITRGQDVHTTVHLGRGPNAAQKIALLWLQPRCSNEACPGTFTEIDHQIEYRKTKHTTLSELDPLCTHCHDEKTINDWALVEGKGRRAFVPPDDPRHPNNKPPP